MGKARRRGDRVDLDGRDCSKLYLERKLLELRVPEAELLDITTLPPGLDRNEWLASHTIGFFEHINLLYGTVSEFCTPSTCPDMTAPGHKTYAWQDDRGKKLRLSAPQYIDYVMALSQRTINDETVFPTKHGHEFVSSFFDPAIKRLHKLLFHVLAHLYHAHFKQLVLLQLHTHLNAVFAHFVEFAVKFDTVEDKELEVLQDLIEALRLARPVAMEDDEEARNLDAVDEAMHTRSSTPAVDSNIQ